MNLEQLIKVGMADLNIARDGQIIRTTGLGSCVGLTLFDERAKIAGMAHIMLPDSSIANGNSFNLAKFADTAIPELIYRMKKAGAEQRRFTAKMAGGAQMFMFSAQTDMMRIGPRNVETSKEILKKLGIPLISEDTGANYGRTIDFNSATGILHISSVKQGVKEI